ncbi:MAG: glycosyltransferase [Chitinophagaceae bacterium]|nr:glycosyltransferase [Chitinophagaceae bacterium]
MADHQSAAERQEIRVMQAIDSLAAGGAEMVAVNFANGMAAMPGVVSYLLSTRVGGALEARVHPTVTLHLLGRRRLIDLPALYRLWKYLRQHRIQIVHAHGSAYLMFIAIQPFSRFKLIWHDHHGLALRSDGKREYPYRTFSFLFSHVFCVSEPLLQNNRRYLKLAANKVSLLYNYAIRRPVNTAERLAKPDGPCLVMNANLRPQKDHLNLIAAIAILRQRLPNIRVYCTGADTDRAWKQQLDTAVRDAALQGQIIFTGSVANPFAYFEIADVAVLSSESEGLPLTVIEYGLAGCPVVATQVGQVADVVQPDAGWLVPAKQPAALADALYAALTDRAEAARRATRLQQHCQQFFSEQQALQQVLGVYRQVLHSGKK